MSKRLLFAFCALLLCLGSTFAQTLESILENHDKVTKPEKVFSGETLAYVTPWNQKGYEISRKYPNKFTFISPTWYDIKPKSEQGGKLTEFKFEGEDAIDIKWLEDMKKSDPSPKILPRFSITLFSERQVTDLKKFSIKKLVIEFIVEQVKKHEYDGAVLEASGAESYLLEFITELSKQLRSNSKMLILVIAPIRDQRDISGLLPQLAKVVDRFSLMTYDFSNPMNPGPTSPIGWVRDNLIKLTAKLSASDKSKILMGLNFYGYDYVRGGGGSAILSSGFLQIIKDKKTKWVWNDQEKEHSLEYNRNHILYFPSYDSIHFRTQLAKEYNVGISIWEIGQGLDYWLDML